jgi:16S rRNA processing protein RimM
MKDLVLLIARALVDTPDEVEVEEVSNDRGTILQLSVAKEDIGKVIGKDGRTAQAIRTVLSAASNKGGRRVQLDIVDLASVGAGSLAPIFRVTVMAGSAKPGAAAPRLVALAEIARPHGVKGELKLKLYNADSDLLLEAEEVVIEHTDGEREIARIQSARRANDALLVRLEGCGDRDEADALRGAKLLLPRDVFPPLDEGEFYVVDIVGAKVISPDGEVGTVEDMITYPTCDAFVVVTTRGRIEIPLVEGVVEGVDTAERIVRVTSRAVLEPA